MIEATEKQAKALALRRAGATWMQIAREIGVKSDGTARHYYNAALLKEMRAARKKAS